MHCFVVVNFISVFFFTFSLCLCSAWWGWWLLWHTHTQISFKKQKKPNQNSIIWKPFFHPKLKLRKISFIKLESLSGRSFSKVNFKWFGISLSFHCRFISQFHRSKNNSCAKQIFDGNMKKVEKKEKKKTYRNR